MRLIILGPPGAGKGTQAVKLSEHFNIPHISTGDLFRDNISRSTELGTKAQMYMDKGELVPAELTIAMVKDRLAQSDAEKGFILDGFPRSVEQAEALCTHLSAEPALTLFIDGPAAGLDGILSFTIADDVVVERMLSRGRADDTEEIIRNRLRVYAEQTAPLIEHYSNAISSIDALGTVDEVFSRALTALSQ